LEKSPGILDRPYQADAALRPDADLFVNMDVAHLVNVKWLGQMPAIASVVRRIPTGRVVEVGTQVTV